MLLLACYSSTWRWLFKVKYRPTLPVSDDRMQSGCTMTNVRTNIRDCSLVAQCVCEATSQLVDLVSSCLYYRPTAVWLEQVLIHSRSAFSDMSRDYTAMLLAVICVLLSTEASGQPTVNDYGTCDNHLPTSEQVANLIRKGMEKVLASNQQHSACTPTTEDPLKQALVSALKCECQCSIFCPT